jgi:hypothetical protein
VISWAFLGYRIVDGRVSLTYCRAEQDHLHHDMRVLVGAAKGRLSSDAFVAARGELEPELPRKLDEGNTLVLRTVVLQFGENALLHGVTQER